MAVNAAERTDAPTFLFTDIEGSSRLWEEQSERMRRALARHDAILRSAVERQRGRVVKSTGDGMLAAFDDPRDAIAAVLDFQRVLKDPGSTAGLALRVRCGMHAGPIEKRDGDFFGNAVNRAARIMSAANGGQALVSQAVAEMVGARLPQDTSLRDLGAVRLRDLLSPERVFQLAHPDLRADFPPLRSLEATPNNLPQQITSFVGRERARPEVKELLGHVRLVTLLGPGGIGKTRLALQVGADLTDDFPDGVWFVELASLTDARLVPQAVAAVLGVREEAGRSLVEALVAHVHDRQLLLILDNCEHLVRACAGIADELLRSGPRVEVLATSREPLRLTAETTFSVSALTFPDPTARIDPEALTRYEAVRLFVDRARAVVPGFALTAENASAVTAICRHLDGIPLAIELAVARIRTLPVRTLAARLDDRFRLLTGGERTARPRQQTLRALIDWSYELLASAEHTLFRRLAVFAGGFALEAAESVGTGGAIARSDVLDLLSALVEKSLVAADVDGERFHLLETVRQYALERLAESGEGDAARARHLAFYVALAESARAKLTGPEQGIWLARLDLEWENLLAAQAWSEHAEDGAELGLRLVYGVQPYWIKRGRLDFGHRALADALARPGAQLRTLVRAKALFAAGWLAFYMGRYAEAQDHLEESLAIAREIGEGSMIAIVLQPLGMASLGRGESAKARQYLQEALVLARERSDRRQIAAALNALAQLTRLEGALDEAASLYEDALALERELGDRESIAFALLNLAMASIGRGHAERARAMLVEALAIAEEIGSMPAGQSVLEVSAGLNARDEDWKRAALFFGAAEAKAAATGLRRDPADEAFLAPLIAKTQAALGAEAYAVAEAGGRALAYEEAIAAARAWLGERER